MRKIYLDMDNTIADFTTPFLEQGGDFEKGVYPHEKIGFFENLEPFPNVVDVVKNEIATKFEVWFLTRPSVFNKHCYTEKANWIHKHFGFDYLRRLILMPDKSHIKANPNDFLIDDYDGDGQTEFDGIWIHYRHEQYPWKNWQEWMHRENDPR